MSDGSKQGGFLRLRWLPHIVAVLISLLRGFLSFRWFIPTLRAVNAYAALVAAAAVIVGTFVSSHQAAQLGAGIERARMETRALGLVVFRLIAGLHPDRADAVRNSQDEYGELGIHIDRVGVLLPPLRAEQVSIARSQVDTNKWAFRVAALPSGASRAVYAICQGRVTAIGKDERGLIALQTSDEYRYVTEYDHLAELGPGVATGKEIRQGQIVGFIRAASQPCLRIGLKTPTGRYLDIRPFLSPMVPAYRPTP
jgi:hypothetical protein